ncbi:MAG: alpha/beta hydrolase [Saprospiraceae bacterium]|nr:alpha/beta hydrolase [Saprospiraceae bacterium]
MSRFLIFVFCAHFLIIESKGQQKINGQFVFRNVLKKYSLYLPSGQQHPYKAVLAFHPLNTARWNAISWRDTLVTFAEHNQLMLICPDGGADGRVDDEVDTAFTTRLLDSVMFWHPYDADKLIALGFSWGGRTVYSYGLSRPDLIHGLIPIGAAIDGTDQLRGKEEGAKNKNIYIVHGSLDAVNTRFYPALQFLSNTRACVRDSMLLGIEHTIDFPNRNSIISDAYQWVYSNLCSSTDLVQSDKLPELQVIYRLNGLLIRNLSERILSFRIIDINSNVLFEKTTSGIAEEYFPLSLVSGVYFFDLKNNRKPVSFIVP